MHQTRTTQGRFSIDHYDSYEDYLDEHIDERDLFFLGDHRTARDLYENGLGGTGKDFLSRQQFDELKERSRAAVVTVGVQKKRRERICSLGKDLVDHPLLHALQKRERLVRDGKLSTIIFIRHSIGGEEVSGYIDYSQRLQDEDFEEYFNLSSVLLPKPTDLSYYNWKTRALHFNETSNFSILTRGNHLAFKHKRNRKTIEIDPTAPTSSNPYRKRIRTDEYLQCVLYEHSQRSQGGASEANRNRGRGRFMVEQLSTSTQPRMMVRRANGDGEVEEEEEGEREQDVEVELGSFRAGSRGLRIGIGSGSGGGSLRNGL